MAVGAKANALSEPQILGVQVTTCLYNTAIPLLIGKRRASGSVIWYGYFENAGASNKKGKSAKKGQPPNYQANLDLLLCFGPVWNIQAAWNNSTPVGYASGLAQFSQAGNQTYTITAASSMSGTVTNFPGGYNLDFISAISFTPSSPLSVTIDDYGDPLGSRTITESESVQWLYNIYDNYSSSGPGAVAWRPGTWEFGQPMCNNASCEFPIGTDHGGANWSVEFPAAVTGTITVYWGATEANHDNPLTYIKYEFESELGSGNEYNGSLSSQQIIYPELSGCGGVQIDLGATGTAPELDVEPQGLYSLTNSGQANPADIILDLILSGNIFFPGAAPQEWVPLCFSHGLNFGGDPTRTLYSPNPGYPGTQTWPPLTSFPWVLPTVTEGSNATTGGLFQILRDPPAFLLGTYNSGTDYQAGSIVEDSSVYYRAITYANGAPTGAQPLWEIFTGNVGAASSPNPAFPFSDGLTDVRNYCAANGIFASLLLKSQRPCSEVLNDVCEVANCVPVWNGQTLDFYPLSEVSCVGGGYQFTPRTAAGPIAAFDKRHFVAGENEPPVTVKQENLQSVVNILDINYADANFDTNGMVQYASYQSNNVRVCDVEHVRLYGPQIGSPRSFDDYICDPTTATNVGWPIIKRQRFADPYTVEFKLPATIASLLDPMDLITVNDPLFGGTLTTGIATTGPTGQDVRIGTLEEDKDGTWTLDCERFMFGMSAPNVPVVTGSIPNPPPSSFAPAGSVNTPYFFEPTVALAQALGMQQSNGLCIAVSGSASNYGGCQVWVSTDGGNSYQQMPGALLGNSNMGVTTANYPNHTNPDTTDTLSVDLTESSGTLQSWTSAQQTQLVPIALLDGGGTSEAGGYTTTVPYEIVAYKAVTLTATYKYNLTPSIFRGQLGSPTAAHSTGTVFVDLSDPNSIFKTQIPSGQILGNTLYFMFPTFNQFGQALQDLSACTAYTFAPTGATNPGGSTGGSAYTISPNPCVYQGRSGGWSGVDSGSTGWTNPDSVYTPPIAVNYGTETVNYSATDSGTAVSQWPTPGGTVYVCIHDPSHAGGTPTIDIQTTNAHATTPGYVYLGPITYNSGTPTQPGGSGGSSGSGGPQDPGGSSYLITVNGSPIA